MKQPAVFLMFVAVAMSEMLTKEDIDKPVDICLVKWKPSNGGKDSITTVNHTSPETPEGNKCFIGCICEGWGMIDKDGAFSQHNTDAFDTLMVSFAPPTEKANFEKELEKAIIVNAKCASIVKPNKDPCVTGPAIFKCFMDEGKTLYMRA